MAGRLAPWRQVLCIEQPTETVSHGWYVLTQSSRGLYSCGCLAASCYYTVRTISGISGIGVGGGGGGL